MANANSASAKGGLTRGKAVLIGVLAVVLVGVLYIQFGGAGEEVYVESTADSSEVPPVTGAAASQPVKASAVEAGVTASIEAAVVEFDQARWKSPELATVVSYDPFALPAKFPQPPVIDPLDPARAEDSATAAARAKELADAVEALRMQLETLKERGVHVIVNKGDQYVAMIGDRMIHVGDEIDGFTVTAIGPQGVRVERKDP